MNEIDLKNVVSNNDNSRESAPKLQGLGYGIVQSIEGSEKPSLFELALGNSDAQARYCELIDQHEEELADLALNIDERGQLQNCRVRKMGDGKYALTFGVRRCLAVLYLHAKHGKSAKVIATISKADDKVALIESAAENIHLPLSYIDQARLFRRLRDQGMTVKQIAKVYPMGKATEQNIRHRLRLLELRAEVQLKVHHGKLSQEAALKLLTTKETGNEAAPVEAPKANLKGEETPGVNEQWSQDEGTTQAEEELQSGNYAKLQAILKEFNDGLEAFDLDGFSFENPVELLRLVGLAQKKLKALKSKLTATNASKSTLALVG